MKDSKNAEGMALAVNQHLFKNAPAQFPINVEANRRNSFNAPVVSQEQHADNTKINSRLSPTALETVPIVQRPIEQNAPTYFSSQGRQSQEFQGQNRQVAVGDYNIKQTGNNPNEFGSRVIIMRSEQVPRPVSAQVFLFTLSFHY